MKYYKKILKNFRRPPCNSSLVTSFVKSVIAKSEGKMFTEGVSSPAEGELAPDETALTAS